MKPWIKSWQAGHSVGPVSRPLRHNGQPYSGINILTLWASTMERGFDAPLWVAFRQAPELGGHVRNGEKGAPVVYANTLVKTELDEQTGDGVEQAIPFMKGYTVFNVDQIDDLPGHFYGKSALQHELPERIDHAETFFEAVGAEVLTGGSSADYSVKSDHIQMRSFELFFTAESYYATLAHEATHWTRHPSRLDWDLGLKRFGDEGYAREELVAELGAAFLCADLGLHLEARQDHAAYIGSWLEVLKNDKRAIFGAAAHAQRAVDCLHGLLTVPYLTRALLHKGARSCHSRLANFHHRWT